jgi:DNA-binding MarR family transcriptional regulator
MNKRDVLVDEYMQVMAMVQRQVMPIKARSAAELGLSRPQAEALHLLSCRDWATIKLMAELLGISSSAATQLTEGLVQMDLVTRQSSAEDRRVVEVRLTKHGSAKVTDLRNASKDHVAQLLTGMTDQEILDLVLLLKKLAHSSGADRTCTN